MSEKVWSMIHDVYITAPNELFGREALLLALYSFMVGIAVGIAFCEIFLY